VVLFMVCAFQGLLRLRSASSAMAVSAAIQYYLALYILYRYHFVQNMKSTPHSLDPSQPIDRLSSLLERFRVRADLFHAGPLCGNTHFAAKPGRGFLHVMRRGEMVVTHRARGAARGGVNSGGIGDGIGGAPKRIKLQEPTLLFYPRPLAHDFHNAPAEGADFVCATLDFEGGEHHPLVRALPALVVLPLRSVSGLDQTLSLLFAEAQQVRCGQRLLANRLFEVLMLQLLRWMLDHPTEVGLPAGLLTGLSHPKLARTLTALHERPADAWNLENMAEAAGMSRTAFASAFKTHLGDTPADYLLRWRVSLMQTLLRDGVSIKAAADQLGYATAASLSRAFTQVVGESPRGWLRRDR
jgi:AraC-like DNA-binding protein